LGVRLSETSERLPTSISPFDCRSRISARAGTTCDRRGRKPVRFLKRTPSASRCGVPARRLETRGT
jgi:hypothetical protein